MINSISLAENPPEYILLRGRVVLGKLKAPFARSGKSVYGAVPLCADLARERLASAATFIRHFGSMSAAYAAAGLPSSEAREKAS